MTQFFDEDMLYSRVAQMPRPTYLQDLAIFVLTTDKLIALPLAHALGVMTTIKEVCKIYWYYHETLYHIPSSCMVIIMIMVHVHVRDVVNGCQYRVYIRCPHPNRRA